MFYFEPTYILVIIGAVICMIASAHVRSTYSKYSKVRSSSGITAEEMAYRMLQEAGIHDVSIQRIGGDLTDHYSPREKVLRLSDAVYGSSSVAALGVACHEVGHAIQHNEGYAPLKLRSLSVPIANFGSFLSWPLIVLGLILGSLDLARVGVFLFTFVVLFQLLTLPVEFDASRRALLVLERDNVLWNEELTGARKVLRAAALTYVAALFSSILQLLRLFLLTQRRDRD